jgi:ferredoxin
MDHGIREKQYADCHRPESVPRLGYAQCVPLAPKALKLSGEEALEYDGNPDDSQRLQVLRAAASCPVQAIIVDELDKARGTAKP